MMRGQRATPWGLHKGKIVSKSNEQEKTGKGKVWIGFMTQRWREIQEQYYRDANEYKTLTGTRWARILVKEFLSFLGTLWQRRNERIHPEQ